MDGRNHIISHHYYDVFEDESALEAYRDPIITVYPENDVRNVAHMQEIFGDTIPVVLRGRGIYHAPWDQITRFRGMENIVMDI